MRCAVESILFNMKHIAVKLEELKGSRFEQLHLSGGLSRFAAVRDLASRIFNLPMLEHMTEESSVLGTAFFTAHVLGIVNDYREISGWNPVVAVHTCEPGLGENYLKAYDHFIKLSEEGLKSGFMNT
jgi:sugar (pentulose or hexulose) kinase